MKVLRTLVVLLGPMAWGVEKVVSSTPQLAAGGTQDSVVDVEP